MMSDKDQSYYKFLQELCPQTLVEVCRLRKSYTDILQKVEQGDSKELSNIWNVSVTKFAKTCNGIKVFLQRNMEKDDKTPDPTIVCIQVLLDSVSASVSISASIAEIYRWKQNDFDKRTNSNGMQIAQYSNGNLNLLASVYILVCIEPYMIIEEGLHINRLIYCIYHQNTDDYVNKKGVIINNNVTIIPQFCRLKTLTYANSCKEEDNSDLPESLSSHQGHSDFKTLENMYGNDHLRRSRKKKPKPYFDKLLMVLLILFTIGHVVNAAPRNENTMMFLKDLLESKYCNMDKWYSKNELCHTNGNKLKDLIDSCEFSDLCNEDEKPYCINTHTFGAFVCLDKNLSCQKGRYYKAGIDINYPRKILLQEDNCPGRTYQSDESDCIQACVTIHRDLEDIPEKYVVYSVGNTTNPTLVYCNFKLGYFNEDGNFLLDFDIEELRDPFFCDYVGDYNPCKERQQPLPNGTCVDICDIGFTRNAPDFVCTPTTNIYPTKEPLPSRPTTSKTLLTTMYVYPNTPTVPSTSMTTGRPPITDDKDNVTNYYDNQNSEFPLWAIVLIAVLVAVVLVLVVVSLSKKRATIYKYINNIKNLYAEVNTEQIDLQGRSR